MASDGRHGAGRLADRLAPAPSTSGGVQLFYRQQHPLGHLGPAHKRLRIDRPAVLPVRDEFARVQEKYPVAADGNLFHRLPNDLHQINLLERLDQPWQLRGEALQPFGVASSEDDRQGRLTVAQ